MLRLELLDSSDAQVGEEEATSAAGAAGGYALSRFPLGYKHKILLYLIAPMAFPAMVAMIPNFLLLKELHLLNAYWALILPSLASGFFIFLLKGFFDSLPPELYEAASIEGANEWQTFFHVTLPMLLMFLLVQRTIMRGIVIPVMK